MLTPMCVPSWRMKSSIESSTYTYRYKDIRFKALSNVRRMVIDESPSSLSSLAVMQMDDDLPVDLNVYISMFKQW